MPTTRSKSSGGNKSLAAHKGLSAAEQKKHFERIKKELEQLRGTIKKGDDFVTLTDEQLGKKLKRTNTPFFVAQSWSAAAAGGVVNYSVSITNPDPISQSSLWAHVFVGPANPVSDLGDFLQIVDARFPRLTQPTTSFGLTLASGASQTLSFSINVPAGMQPGRYLGNTVLIQLNLFDVGTSMDRCAFGFLVT